MVRLILEEKESNPKKQTKRQKKMAANKEKTCPLCLEPLDLEDINFYPCKCGYQTIPLTLQNKQYVACTYRINWWIGKIVECYDE
ncbi:hypothetical protein AVEN_102003-1 [Araneus ventricosus]|uniref:Uncharacterized protein n=1 Tax=Araneus ventricosus TaxID=182803 RepID=A0A4Y2TUC5_ARAVE|nr:hypothetical protein AVEN_102003-1 [Araneus ventricosus]